MPAPMILYTPERLDRTAQQERASAFFEEMDKRRGVRFFSDDPVPLGSDRGGHQDGQYSPLRCPQAALGLMW